MFEPRRFAPPSVFGRALPSLAPTGLVIPSTPPSTSVWKTTGKNSRRRIPTSTKKTMDPGVRWWRKTVERFLQCGILGHGFARLRYMTAIRVKSSTAPPKESLNPWMPWTGLPGSARTSPVEMSIRSVIRAVTLAPHVGNDVSRRKPSTARVPRTAPPRRSPRPSASAAGAGAAGLVCSARSMTSIPCAVVAAALCA